MSDPTVSGGMNQVGSGEEPENPGERNRKVVGAILLAGAPSVVGIWIAVGLANQQTYRAPDARIANPLIDSGPDPWLAGVARRPPTIEELEIPALPKDLPFDMSGWTISEDRVLLVGPAKDGVLALTNPAHVHGSETDIEETDQVVCVAIGDEAVAYPKTILAYHMVVNDIVGGQPITVTYYPVTDTALVFNAEIENERREFAVTGMVYNCSVLMHDRSADGKDSLWCQMMTEGVTGRFANHELEIIPFEVSKWHVWKSRYPHSKVLSKETGYKHVYSINPFDMHEMVSSSLYPIERKSDRVPQKDRVLGVWVEGGSSRAYAFSTFGDNSAEIEQTLDGKKFTFVFDRLTYTARIKNADPGLKVAYCWWNAWYGFHPDTEIYGKETLAPKEAGDQNADADGAKDDTGVEPTSEAKTEPTSEAETEPTSEAETEPTSEAETETSEDSDQELSDATGDVSETER